MEVHAIFLGSHSPLLRRQGDICRGGVNRRESTFDRLLHAKFHPIGAVCLLWVTKNLRIAPE